MDDVICSVSKVVVDLGSCKLNDNSTDVSIYTGDGACIRAHKSILISCPYFSAMLQGDWIENQTSSIKITGYSVMLLQQCISHF